MTKSEKRDRDPKLTEYTVTKAKSEKATKKVRKKRGRSPILTEYTMTKLYLKLVQI